MIANLQLERTSPRTQGTVLALAAAALCACSGDPSTPETRGVAAGKAWFEDMTDESGLCFEHIAYDEQRYLMPECVGAGIALIDFDGDGDLDVYCLQSGDPTSTGTPSSTNRLFRNDGSGSFEDVTEASGAAPRWETSTRTATSISTSPTSGPTPSCETTVTGPSRM
ncbi:MAG: FG-GAP repeat domain-containing protein [Planctomycetota bacterium]